jgi:hypothetical protein
MAAGSPAPRPFRAKFWLKAVNELKARGFNDILTAVADGLKGFPMAITSVPGPWCRPASCT